MNRSSIKIPFLKVLQHSHRNNCVGGLFLNKNAALDYWNFIKKRLQLRCFPMNIAKFLRTPVLKNICERLFERLLHQQIHNKQQEVKKEVFIS